MAEVRRGRIVGVRAGVLSADEIRAYSAVRVTDPTIYRNHKPNPQGCNDHRLGVSDRRIACGTCGHAYGACHGHAGHVELAYPVYHVGHLQTLVRVLRVLCFWCSEFVGMPLRKAATQSTGRKRFGLVAPRPSLKHCPSCDGPLPTYRAQRLRILATWRPATLRDEVEVEAARRPFTAREAYGIVAGASDETLAMLGFDPAHSHPKDLILCALVVPPATIRHTVVQSTGSRIRGQDDLTKKLQDVVRANVAIEKHHADAGARLHSGADARDTPTALIEKLQTEVALYFNNDLPGVRRVMQRSGAHAKTLIQRLRDKKGRVRYNLMGKRVDHSARCVISPDPNIALDEVGVPEGVARTLTVPEVVRADNVAELQALVAAGPDAQAGAKRVLDSTGTVLDLARYPDDRGEIELQEGWIVERHLRDGDHVVFNRQPSLHKGSMMGHRVVVMPGHTFRLNLLCTKPYNADFDGDEMNMHVPQSAAAQAEVATLMSARECILSPQSSAPEIGIVQDALVGAWLLTQAGTVLTAAQAQFCLAQTEAGAHARPGRAAHEAWTGHEVASALLPAGLTWTTPDGEVEVVDGVLVRGALGKAAVGAKRGSLIEPLVREFGSARTARFLEDLQRCANAFLLTRAVSVGPRDCLLHPRARARVAAIAATALAEGNAQTLAAAQRGGREAVGALETRLFRLGNSVRTAAGRIVAEAAGHSAFRTMAAAGSKGSLINHTQVAGAVGQQCAEGARVSSSRTTSRTLACFSPFTFSMEERGLVAAPYVAGLGPVACFLHSIAAREALIDTAVKTARTGYIQRCLVKGMEGHMVANDRTVRCARGAILQLRYGGDGLDPTQCVRAPRAGAGPPTAPAGVDARVCPGEMVGVLAAASVGAPCTQMTLNTFHLAGVSAVAVVQGVPRIRELIDTVARTKTPVIRGTLRRPFAGSVAGARAAAASLRFVRLRDVMAGAPTLLPDGQLGGELGMLATLLAPELDTRAHSALVFRLDPRLARAALVSTADVAVALRHALEGGEGIRVVAACDHAAQVGVVLPSATRLELSRVAAALAARVQLSGVHGMAQAAPVPPEAEGGAWKLDLEGTDLRALAHHPALDPASLWSNSPREMHAVLGIEACHEVIVRELCAVLDTETFVDPRHVMLLAATMTRSGAPAPFTRFTINRPDEDAGWLFRSTFECIQQVITDASAFAELDPLASVSSAIMLGLPLRIGAGCAGLAPQDAPGARQAPRPAPRPASGPGVVVPSHEGALRARLPPVRYVVRTAAHVELRSGAAACGSALDAVHPFIHRRAPSPPQPLPAVDAAEPYVSRVMAFLDSLARATEEPPPPASPRSDPPPKLRARVGQRSLTSFRTLAGDKFEPARETM
jgi:DNA-directed RNA polymerase beta' subunit